MSENSKRIGAVSPEKVVCGARYVRRHKDGLCQMEDPSHVGKCGLMINNAQRSDVIVCYFAQEHLEGTVAELAAPGTRFVIAASDDNSASAVDSNFRKMVEMRGGCEIIYDPKLKARRVLSKISNIFSKRR